MLMRTFNQGGCRFGVIRSSLPLETVHAWSRSFCAPARDSQVGCGMSLLPLGHASHISRQKSTPRAAGKNTSRPIASA